MNPLSRLDEILTKLRAALVAIDPSSLRNFCNEILATRRIFLIGAGRSGCIAKMFATRLAQIGLDSRLIGESTTPPINSGDLLIVCSGSARTTSVSAIAKKALALNARLILISFAENSFLAKHAAVLVKIPLSQPADFMSAPTIDSQLLNSLFEQAALLLTDLVTKEIATQLGVDNAKLRSRHANLE